MLETRVTSVPPLFSLSINRLTMKPPPPAKDLIRGLINVESSQRLTVTQALDHPWLQVSLFPFFQTEHPVVNMVLSISRSQDAEIKDLVSKIVQVHEGKVKEVLTPVFDFALNSKDPPPENLQPAASTGTDSDFEQAVTETQRKKRKMEPESASPDSKRRTSPRKTATETSSPSKKT